jgi:hypothetical protein
MELQRSSHGTRDIFGLHAFPAVEALVRCDCGLADLSANKLTSMSDARGNQFGGKNAKLVRTKPAWTVMPALLTFTLVAE